MSRLYKINKKYNKFLNVSNRFILSVFLRKFLKVGKHLRANKLIVQTFDIIKSKEPYNSYLVFLIALYNISPRVSIKREVNCETKQLVYKRKLLTKHDSLMLGIKLLAENYKKNKGRSFCTKLASEIIMSFYKKSFSYSKKIEIEREIIKKTAKIFVRKKRVNFFVLN